MALVPLLRPTSNIITNQHTSRAYLPLHHSLHDITELYKNNSNPKKSFQHFQINTIAVDTKTIPIERLRNQALNQKLTSFLIKYAVQVMLHVVVCHWQDRLCSKQYNISSFHEMMADLTGQFGHAHVCRLCCRKSAAAFNHT